MDDDAFLLFALGLAAWFLLRNSNHKPGTFSPYAPAYGTYYQNQIMPLTVSAAGRQFIKNQEGFSPTPYADAGGHSIGYGHFIQPGENFTSMTEQQASNQFDVDLIPVEDAINTLVTVPINQNQFDALADFIYNDGINAFRNSTLLRKLNAGDYQGAADEFSRWVYSAGQVNPALQARRQAEQSTFTAG